MVTAPYSARQRSGRRHRRDRADAHGLRAGHPHRRRHRQDPRRCLEFTPLIPISARWPVSLPSRHCRTRLSGSASESSDDEQVAHKDDRCAMHARPRSTVSTLTTKPPCCRKPPWQVGENSSRALAAAEEARQEPLGAVPARARRGGQRAQARGAGSREHAPVRGREVRAGPDRGEGLAWSWHRNAEKPAQGRRASLIEGQNATLRLLAKAFEKAQIEEINPEGAAVQSGIARSHDGAAQRCAAEHGAARSCSAATS